MCGVPYDVFSLLLCPLSVDHVHVDPIVDQLSEQVFGSVLGLHEQQHWGLEAYGG